MTSAFYGKAQGVAVVFDVSRIDTFQSLDSWINDIREVSISLHLYPLLWISD